MQTLATELVSGPQSETSVLELWRRALTAETSVEREEAAWEVFLAAVPGTRMPPHWSVDLPADVRPLLTIARERSLGCCMLTPLLRMQSDVDVAVRKAAARAMVRLWLIAGEWDSETARRHVRQLRLGASQPAAEEAIEEFSPQDLESTLTRLKGDHLRTSVWTAPVGFALLVALVVAFAGIGIGFKMGVFVGGVGSLLFHIGRMLLCPGSFSSEGKLKRWGPLLARIEERADENPEALKSVERELRLLTLRISDQPKEVREAAVRLVRRIEEVDRNIGQLPIAVTQPTGQTEALPLPSAANDSEAGIHRG